MSNSERENGLELKRPFDAVNYAQIDFWLTGEACRRNVLDVQSRKDIFFDTDHFIVEMRIRISALNPKQREKDMTKRYYKPTSDRWLNYNAFINQQLRTEPITLDRLNETRKTAASMHLEQIPLERKKTYLTRNTRYKIDCRNEKRRLGATTGEIKQLNKDIAKSAAINRQNFVIDRFTENPHDTNKKHMWKAVKDLKKKFVPQYVKMKNKAGVHVPLIKRAESIAEYLETEHWTNVQQSEPPNNRKLVEENGANLDVFDLQDLNHALKQTKANKQPGPDGIVMELYKWLDTDNRQFVLNLINTWWIERKAPEDLFIARVVPIYKKGDTDNAANYRPISLLNSAYKIYMMLIRSRMQSAVSQHITKTQYSMVSEPICLHLMLFTLSDEYKIMLNLLVPN